jgi:hypothetical protein
MGGVPVVRVTLEERVTSEAALVETLARGLGLEGVGRLDELIDRMRRGPRRLLLVDQGQNLMLRAVGGLSAFEAFSRVAVMAEATVPVVCTFSAYAWQYLVAVTQERSIFKHTIELGPWAEEDIARLVNARMEALGIVPSYEDLVVDRLDGTALDHEVIRTGERYLRLLWDYSDGNPRVALHFWLRSLLPESEGRVRVRLFAAPEPDALEPLGEQARFLLAAVVIHENISTDELSRVLCLPQHQVASTVEFLRAQGLLVIARSRIRVTTHWNRAVLRYLRRKHLLYG